VKTVASFVAIALMAMTARFASAEESIAPPAGWEVPPAPEASNDKPAKDKKKIGPACCKFDQTCCSRQAEIDSRARPLPVVRVVEVRMGDVPEATLREAAEGAPPITENVPPVRLINEDNQPFPWPSPPKQIRMLPPGPIGEIGWNVQWGPSPSFDEDEFKGLGWGDIHNTKENVPYTNDGEIAGKVEYLSVQQGQGDKLVLDIAKGTVSGSPALKATYHLHVEAAHVTDKVVHVYRVTTKEKDTSTTWVNFLLPQVIEGFESPHAKHQGGFFPSRFSRSWSYSLYRLPYGPGRSNMATFRLDDDDKRRWIGVSKQRPPKIKFRHVLVATSQTSVESEPRTQVMFFEEFASTF
jgi:hypothetical protein